MKRNPFDSTQWTDYNSGANTYGVITKVKDTRDPNAKYEYELEFTGHDDKTKLSYHPLRRDAVSALAAAKVADKKRKKQDEMNEMYEMYDPSMKLFHGNDRVSRF